MFDTTITAGKDEDEEIDAQWRASADRFCANGKLIPLMVDTSEALLLISKEDALEIAEFKHKRGAIAGILGTMAEMTKRFPIDTGSPDTEKKLAAALMERDSEIYIVNKLNDAVQTLVSRVFDLGITNDTKYGDKVRERLETLETEYAPEPAPA